MRTVREWAVRGGVLVFSLTVCGLGTALYVNAALGNDPLTAFIQGLSIRLGCSYGGAMNIVNAAAILFVLVMDRHFIHLGTLLSLLLGGIVSDFMIGALQILLGPAPHITARIVLLLAGTACIGFGVGLYQAARLGVSPMDALNQIAASRLNLPLRYERMLCDGLLLACALLLGGTVSVGTVVSMLCVGPVMASVLGRFSKTVDRWSIGSGSASG